MHWLFPLPWNRRWFHPFILLPVATSLHASFLVGTAVHLIHPAHTSTADDNPEHGSSLKLCLLNQYLVKSLFLICLSNLCLISSFWTRHPAHLLLWNDPGRWRNAAVEIKGATLVQVISELGVMWQCWKSLYFQRLCFKTWIINCAAEKQEDLSVRFFCIKSRLAHSDQLFLHEELFPRSHIPLQLYIFIFLQQRVGWEHPVPHIHDPDE